MIKILLTILFILYELYVFINHNARYEQLYKVSTGLPIVHNHTLTLIRTSYFIYWVAGIILIGNGKIWWFYLLLFFITLAPQTTPNAVRINAVLSISTLLSILILYLAKI